MNGDSREFDRFLQRAMQNPKVRRAYRRAVIRSKLRVNVPRATRTAPHRRRDVGRVTVLRASVRYLGRRRIKALGIATKAILFALFSLTIAWLVFIVWLTR